MTLRKMLLVKSLAVVMVAVSSSGCGSSELNLEESSSAGVQSATVEMGLRGYRLTRKLRATDYSAQPDEMTRDQTRDLSSKPSPLDSMTREELADAFRLLVLDADGSEYIEEEPNWKVADLIIKSRLPSHEPLEPTPGKSLGRGEEAPEEFQGNGIFGTDTRSRITSSHLYPYSAIGWFVGASCTGTMIGPSTMITAAHCTHDGTTWRTQRAIEFGVNSQKSPRSSFPTESCYLRSVPSGWVGNNHVDFDYAIFEFNHNCGRTPGHATGWFGVWAAQDAHIDASPYFYSYGYPADWDNDYGGVTCPGGTCYRPSVWGTSSDWKGVKNGDEIKHKVDTHGGQSGSAVYVLDAGHRYIIGVHKGQTWDLWHGGYHNHGKRMNAGFLNHIESASQGKWSRGGPTHRHPWHP